MGRVGRKGRVVGNRGGTTAATGNSSSSRDFLLARRTGYGMYPRSDIELNPELPAAADFWTPDPRDVDENDGFGNFDNVWAILNVSVEHAWRVFRRDRFFCTLVASLAANEQEFDVLASVAETGSADEVEGITPDQLSALVGHFPEAEELEDLEIGVAGLVYALAAAGMYPAASCRGHADPNAWSKLPVVSSQQIVHMLRHCNLSSRRQVAGLQLNGHVQERWQSPPPP